jgi:hypothetical protein
MGLKGISAWKKFNIGELGMYLGFFLLALENRFSLAPKNKNPSDYFLRDFLRFFHPDIIQDNALIICCQMFLYSSSDPKIPACILRAAFNILF